MPLLIGMDEAGLGPNLGPFVVAATVWKVPDAPASFDFWTAFDTVLTRTPTSCDPRLHVADSKQVFQPHKGLAALERGVWSALSLCEQGPSTFRELCQSLARPLIPQAAKEPSSTRRSLFDDSELAAARSPSAAADASVTGDPPLPWYPADGFPLPVESGDFSLAGPWRQVCQRLDVRLVAIRADVVEPPRFNRLVRQYDNKSQATSRLAMNLLRNIWHPDDEEALIVADKHGGRNRYDVMLSETFQKPVHCLAEGSESSVYRVGRGELRFEPRAESHGPVALASMTAKYLRELAMTQFNQFWQARIPGLKPTQGYPQDARRFRDDVATERSRLEISDDTFWRER